MQPLPDSGVDSRARLRIDGRPSRERAPDTRRTGSPRSGLTWLARTASSGGLNVCCVAAGLAALAWCTFCLHRHAASRSVWRSMTLERTRARHRVRPLGAGGSAPAFCDRASRQHQLAELSIPRLHLSAVVLEGSDDRHAAARPGPYRAHRAPRPARQRRDRRPSGHLLPAACGTARVGDEVLLDTPEGRWRYQVSSVRIVSPREVSVLDPTAEPTLTLVTCYPFSFVGKAPLRFVVRATGVGFPEPATP